MRRKQRDLILVFAAFCCIGAILIVTVSLWGGNGLSSKGESSSRPASESSEPLKSSAVDSALSSGGAASEEIFWLHKSDLKPPEKSVCLQAQKLALKGLNDEQRKTVQDMVREEHVRIEYYLLDHVKSLKSPDAPYWEFLEHTGPIAIPGEEVVLNEWDKDTITANLKTVGDLIQNGAVKSDFEKMRKTLDDAVGAHDLHGLFSYHEMIHDYDYWVINYPAYYPDAPAPDWGGIKTYFGIPSVLSVAAGP